jgi:capsular polysaccharide biosynthesis protein
MKKTKNWGILFSQKVYERLLTIYPKAHRKEYGSAMAQLFRDQSRDAWSAGRMWGLSKLWFRVLPDLAKTSALEHFANLKGEQTMFQTIISLTRFRHAPLVAFTTVFVVLFVVTMLVTLNLPKSYASTTRIKIDADKGDIPRLAKTTSYRPYDPYFIQTEFEIIQDQVVLGKVIQILNLNEKWGKKYNGGKSFTTAETLKLLIARMSLNTVRNTKLVEITVYSEDRDEAARIANQIAMTYQNEAARIATIYQTFTTSPHFKLQNNVARVYIVRSAEPNPHEIRPNFSLNLMIGMSVGFLLGGMMALITFLFGQRFRLEETSKPINSHQLNTAERIVGILWAFCGGALFGGFVLIANTNFRFTADVLVANLIGVFFGCASIGGFLLYRKNTWVKVPLGTVSAILAIAILAIFYRHPVMSTFYVSELIPDALFLFWLAAAAILLRPKRAKAEVSFPNQ